MVEIADAPAWLPELLNAAEAPAREADPDVALDTPFAVAEARHWLQGQAIVGEEEPGDDYPTIARLKDWALGQDTIARLLIERGAEDSDWLRNTINHAFKYGQNDPGSDRPRSHEEVFADVEPPAPIEDHGFRQIGWLRAQHFPATQWEWHKRIPSFKPIIVTGPPKTGKTTFLLNLAVHIAAGADFLGATTRPTDIVMLLAEDEYGQVRDNLEAIRADCGFDRAVLDRLHIRSVLNEPVGQGHRLCQVDDQGNAHDTPFMREVVAPYLAALDRPIWMVDPLVEFVSFNRFSEQAPRGLVHWLNNVSRIGQGVTPLITDHPTIASVEQGRDIGGNIQMEASFPTVAALKGGKWSHGLTRQKPMSFALKYARYAPEHTVDFFRIEGSPTFSLQGAKGQTKEDHRQLVYRHIAEGLNMQPPRHVHKTNHGYGPQALAAVLMIEEKEVSEALKMLEALSWLQYNDMRGSGPIRGAHYERGPEGPKLAALNVS